MTEVQMVALFGQGRHPNAEAIEAAARAAGKTPWRVYQASRLGQPYRIYDEPNAFRRRSASAFPNYNTDLGLDGDTSVPPEERARMRTELARRMFLEDYGRPPTDPREPSGHLARISRQPTNSHRNGARLTPGARGVIHEVVVSVVGVTRRRDALAWSGGKEMAAIEGPAPDLVRCEAFRLRHRSRGWALLWEDLTIN